MVENTQKWQDQFDIPIHNDCEAPVAANPSQLINRQALITEISAKRSSKAYFACLQQAFDLANQHLIARFYDHGSGLISANERAYVLDELLHVVYMMGMSKAANVSVSAKIKKSKPENEPFCLIITGGYGKGLLCPRSDVDLLFLYKNKATILSNEVIRYILYTLWDLGLKVGHSSMSSGQGILKAKNEHVFATTLLHARFVVGNKKLYESFIKKIHTQLLGNLNARHQFVQDKIFEREERHQKHFDTQYLLEPNIKNGKGGLRDLDFIDWVVKIYFGSNNMQLLFNKKILTARELKQYWRVKQFFFSLRTHLHLEANRSEERLTFDLQWRIADRMGYRSDSRSNSAERLMKHYFMQTRIVANISRAVLMYCRYFDNVIAKNQTKKQYSYIEKVPFKGFKLHANYLCMNEFQKDIFEPIQLVKFFAVCAQNALEPDPEALREITKRAQHLTRKHSLAFETRACFMDVLLAEKNQERLLRQMHESTILGRVIPDFARISSQMQYDMYHVYTTDDHTIRAVGLLNTIEQGQHRDKFPLSSDVIHKIEMRKALYVAVFLHDIAKGRGKDHSLAGEEVALQLCPELGLDEQETQMVAWLVRHHLGMSNVAFRRDLDDPQTIEDFSNFIQTNEKLGLLLCLTVADIAAVGPQVWTSWKATLLRKLYRSTLSRLNGELPGHSALVNTSRQVFKDYADKNQISQVNYLLEVAPHAQFMAYTKEALARQCNLIAMAKDKKSTITFAIDFNILDDESVEMMIYTQDQAGLMEILSGSIALHAGKVIAARASTFSDSMILDHFTLEDTKNTWRDPVNQQKLAKTIKKALFDGEDISKRLLNKPTIKKRATNCHIKPNVTINNNASNASTLIEITCSNQSALLFIVTRTLKLLHLRVSFARIATYGEEAVDIFYVKDYAGQKLYHEHKIKHVRETLLNSLQLQ